MKIKKTAAILLAAVILLSGVACGESPAEVSSRSVAGSACDHARTVLIGASAAACAVGGYTGDRVCTACGEVVEKGTDIAAAGHRTQKQNEKTAGGTEAGYSGDLVCSVCGEVVEKGTVIPPETAGSAFVQEPVAPTRSVEPADEPVIPAQTIEPEAPTPSEPAASAEEPERTLPPAEPAASAEEPAVPSPTEPEVPTPSEPAASAEEPDRTLPQTPAVLVWIPKSGTKFHLKQNCSNMNDPRQVTMEEAEELGFTACKKCAKQYVR